MRSYIPKPLHVAALIAALACGPAACTHNDRADTIHAALVTADTARDALVAYDAKAQAAIVAGATSREDAVQKLATYRDVRNGALGAGGLLVTAYHAIIVATTANDAQSLADMKSVISQLAAAVAPYLAGGK